VPGFGFPLLARFQGSTLVLPNTRNVTILYFDLTGGKPDPTQNHAHITQHLQAAQRFYADLHIDLLLVEGTVPSALQKTTIAFSYYSSPKASGELVDFSNGQPIKPAPDLGDASWGLPSDLSHHILVYWVSAIIGLGPVGGLSFPMLQNSPGVFTVPENTFHTSKNAASSIITMQDLGTNQTAHELGHCLMYAPGLGTDYIENIFRNKSQVMAFLGHLGIEGPKPPSPPGSTTYAKLPQGIHLNQINLMGSGGGNRLTDWQVALIRASNQVGDK